LSGRLKTPLTYRQRGFTLRQDISPQANARHIMAHSKKKTEGYGKAKKVLVIDGTQSTTEAVTRALSRGQVEGAGMRAFFDEKTNLLLEDDVLDEMLKSKTKLSVRQGQSFAAVKQGALIFDWTGDIPVEDQARQ